MEVFPTPACQLAEARSSFFWSWGLPDQHGVVLVAPAKDLDGALKLLVPASRLQKGSRHNSRRRFRKQGVLPRPHLHVYDICVLHTRTTPIGTLEVPTSRNQDVLEAWEPDPPIQSAPCKRRML